MSFKLEKQELEQALMSISTFNVATEENPRQEMISGLLKEELPLSAKRRLQKIHKKTTEHYKEFIEDFKKLREECGEDIEKLNKELAILLKEEVEIYADKVSLSMIEAISTTHNYNFDIIEKFAE